MDSKQQKILEINRRTDISSQEKQKLIQEVFKVELPKENVKPCTHYQKNCDIKCPECSKFYRCRLCHDEYENHKIDRFKITEMRCIECKLIQTVSNKCIQCNIKMATYYCDICHLFDSSNRVINHCDKCGICRIGNNIHCDQCNMCINKDHFENHVCVNFNTNCCICQEGIQFSTISGITLPCKHVLHSKCYQEHILSGNYQCPLCKKSMVNMDAQWNIINQYVENSVMPEEYQDKIVTVFCNDCRKKSQTKFHFAYHKCQECNSWNTDVI